MKIPEPVLIPIRKLITDKELRTLFFETYVDGGCKHDQDYLNQFAPHRCPYCGKFDYSFIGKEKNGLYKYKCNKCEKEFNLLTKTAFDSMPRPLHSFTYFLRDLFDKKFNYEKSMTKDEEYRYSIMFTNLSKIIFKANSVNKPFVGEEILVHLFSYPDEVRDLYRLRNSNDLHNFILAILTDGNKVKLRIVGTGFVNKRFVLNRLSKLINPGSTLVHSEFESYDELVFNKNLKEKIILGDKNTISKAKEIKPIFNLKNEFINFLNYYNTSYTSLFMDMFISTFELVTRKNCTKEDKISFVISLLLNSYLVSDKEMFHYHRDKFDKDISATN